MPLGTRASCPRRPLTPYQAVAEWLVSLVGTLLPTAMRGGRAVRTPATSQIDQLTNTNWPTTMNLSPLHLFNFGCGKCVCQITNKTVGKMTLCQK